MRTSRWSTGLVCLCGFLASCGGGGGNGGGGDGGPITLQGRAITQNGGPAPGVQVFVPGFSPVVSDASGNFTIADVLPPYDLVAVSTPSASEQFVTLIAGLTRPDPNIITAPGSEFSADVSGMVTGGAGRPLPANHSEDMQFIPLHANTDEALSISATTGAYSETVRWGLASSTTFHATVVQFTTDPSGMPVTYTGVATDQFAVSDGDALVRNYSLSSVTTTTVSGSYTLPTGYTLDSKLGAVVTPQPFALLGLPSSTVDDGLFSFNLPEIPGRQFAVLVQADASPASSTVLLNDLTPGATGLVVDLLAAPVVLSPPNGATNVDAMTDFTMSPFAGIYLLEMDAGASMGPTFLLFTGNTSVQIPDLTAYGVFFPSSAMYTCNVAGLSHSDVDVLAGGDSLLGDLPEVKFAQNDGPDFTTAP